MKKQNLILIGLIIAAVGVCGAGGANLFPTIAGLTNPEQPAEYTADNLFEYINGAADVFIGYDFEHLFSMTYSGADGQSIAADIYRHADPACGFGIYSQEKPREGVFLPVGTEGYYETGILNFFQGRYYVKISAFDLGEHDRKTLTDLAQQIASRIPDAAGFPEILEAFPRTGRRPHSEHFIRRNFLGHGFLENAFICEYSAEDHPVRPFIIRADSQSAAQSMVEAYLEFARSHNAAIDQKENGVRFVDPYHKSRGALSMKWRDHYIWGLFSNDTATSERMLSAIGAALPAGKHTE
ncbi:MAG: hypothetical protein JXA62_02360 [Candidatus Aminicenantes bacterium]|nr:hypothetical protein [Candidatus Aminicenantes bacterium]